MTKVNPPRRVKVKTHQATAKRVRRTKAGKLLHRHARERHLLMKKSSRRKRRLSIEAPISKSDRQRVTILIGGKR